MHFCMLVTNNPKSRWLSAQTPPAPGAGRDSALAQLQPCWARSRPRGSVACLPTLRPNEDAMAPGGLLSFCRMGRASRRKGKWDMPLRASALVQCHCHCHPHLISHSKSQNQTFCSWGRGEIISYRFTESAVMGLKFSTLLNLDMAGKTCLVQ